MEVPSCLFGFYLWCTMDIWHCSSPQSQSKLSRMDSSYPTCALLRTINSEPGKHLEHIIPIKATTNQRSCPLNTCRRWWLFKLLPNSAQSFCNCDVTTSVLLHRLQEMALFEHISFVSPFLGLKEFDKSLMIRRFLPYFGLELLVPAFSS